MTTTRLPQHEPSRPPDGDPGALIDWTRVRERVGFALRAARRRPILWTLVFFAIAAVGPFSLAVMPRTYRVEAVVTASRNPTVSSLPDPVLLRPYDSDDPANVARDAIMRRDNLVALCEETDLLDRMLATRPPAARWRDRLLELVPVRAPSREQRLDGLVELLEKRLSVSVPGAQPGAAPGAARDRILIALEWRDAQMAKDFVEAAARRFFAARRERELAVSHDALAALESSAASARKEIEASVSRIHDLEHEMLRQNPALARTYRAPRGRVPQETELAMMRATLDSKRLALAETERYRQVRTGELQAELARERAAYGEEHPAIARTREILERFDAPSPRAEALRAEIAGLEQEFQKMSERAARLVDDEDPTLEYQRTELRLLLAQYTRVRDRLDGARVESEIAASGFDRRHAFAVPAFLPRRPIWPVPALSVAASVLGGALFAFFAVAALDARSGKILERWQLERNLGVRVLGEFRG